VNYSTRKSLSIYFTVENGAELRFADSMPESTGKGTSSPRKGLLVKEFLCVQEDLRPATLTPPSSWDPAWGAFVNAWLEFPCRSGYFLARSRWGNQGSSAASSSKSMSLWNSCGTGHQVKLMKKPWRKGLEKLIPFRLKRQISKSSTQKIIYPQNKACVVGNKFH
jgi:hypothetical protein